MTEMIKLTELPDFDMAEHTWTLPVCQAFDS